MSKKVAVLIGSLRKGSFSRKVANQLINLAPSSLEMQIVEIGQLGHYNQDLDENPPAEWVAFREEIKSVDAVLFVTPEYNRSFSGVLKNAIDIGSRPYGHSVWEGKAGAIVSVTPSPLGAFGANHHLRQPMVFLNVIMMQQPEAYVSNVAGCFNEQGDLVREETKVFLQKYIDAFAAFVEKHAK